LNIQSLGYRTDIMLVKFDGKVQERQEYIVVRTPSSPSFYWGNFLLFPRPPQEGDFNRWRSLFAQEIGVPPVTNHIAFGWDTIQGEKGELASFLNAGFRLNQWVILTATRVQRPPKYSTEVVVRRLTQDWEWEGARQNQIACRDAEHDLPGYTRFVTHQIARYRAMAAAGLGFWFGAFVGDQLVGDLGIFVEAGVGRFAP
jgi:hypothetical protein